ncbi:hypothetical protein [Aquibium sp. ELW1220]|uniref:hypothetical protein n=1 Tax=Aquibium sp. ELW1220 TaxID=2976766 RepID=UPI0025AF3322|nr:hypothetical protein [Aquibium sp. ELW1220]MDN2583938.1 hypothetical protein [Aquibium sp. ELW1220]
MGEPLANPDEVLFRQIHPNCIHNGEPASDRFKPQPNDAGLMSVDRSSLTDAASSHALYTSTGKQSGAVHGLSVEEFGGESIECREDPLDGTDTAPANYAHALADYTPHEEKRWKLISKRLTQKAKARGQLYP